MGDEGGGRGGQNSQPRTYRGDSNVIQKNIIKNQSLSAQTIFKTSRVKSELCLWLVQKTNHNSAQPISSENGVQKLCSQPRRTTAHQPTPNGLPLTFYSMAIVMIELIQIYLLSYLMAQFLVETTCTCVSMCACLCMMMRKQCQLISSQ